VENAASAVSRQTAALFIPSFDTLRLRQRRRGRIPKNDVPIAFIIHATMRVSECARSEGKRFYDWNRWMPRVAAALLQSGIASPDISRSRKTLRARSETGLGDPYNWNTRDLVSTSFSQRSSAAARLLGRCTRMLYLIIPAPHRPLVPWMFTPFSDRKRSHSCAIIKKTVL